MSDCKTNIKQEISQSNRESNWLENQAKTAFKNLQSRPAERRGPYIISDDDLNKKFQLES